jgi:hypothetical protein
MKPEEYALRAFEVYGDNIDADDVIELGSILTRGGLDETAVIRTMADRLDPFWALTHSMSDFKNLCEKALRKGATTGVPERRATTA